MYIHTYTHTNTNTHTTHTHTHTCMHVIPQVQEPDGNANRISMTLVPNRAGGRVFLVDAKVMARAARYSHKHTHI